MEKIKLNRSEIEKLDSLKQKTQQISYELGQLLRQKWSIEASIEEGKNALEEFSKEESSFLEELQKEYGVGSLNVNTYEFTPEEETKE